MKLITEVSHNLSYINEAKEGEDKHLFIEGIFMQAETANRNGRVYPKHILEKEVHRYQDFIKEKRSLGELGHPPSPTINLDKVSHLITELKFDGNNVYGKAKILGTPMGKIAENFINEGIRLGVSSRGLGSLKANKAGINEVQNDFFLATVDIVADPSAPDAFVQGIMENREWMIVDGIWTAVDSALVRESIKATTKTNLVEAQLKAWQTFVSRIQNI